MVTVGDQEVFFLIQMEDDYNYTEQNNNGIIQVNQGYNFPIPNKAVSQGKAFHGGDLNPHVGLKFSIRYKFNINLEIKIRKIWLFIK